MSEESKIEKTSELDRWFKEKWVDISRKDKSGKYAPCGRRDADSGKYPKCRPSKRVNRETPVTTRGLTDKEEKSAIRKKRKTEKEKSTESAGGKSRKPKRAPVIKRSDSRMIELVSLYKMAMNHIVSFAKNNALLRCKLFLSSKQYLLQKIYFYHLVIFLRLLDPLIQ